MDTHKSDEKVVQERKLYTGLSKFRVIAINPSMEEMEKIGLRATKEPEYTTKEQSEEGEEFTRTRVDVWVEKVTDPKIKTKFAIFLTDRKRKSRDGQKLQYINTHGQLGSFAESVEELPDWFEKDGVREAYENEVKLHDFMFAWLNVKNNLSRKEQDEGKKRIDISASLDTMDKIVKGNLKELRDYVKSHKDNEVILLAMVRDGKYQDIYTGHFGRASTPGVTYWKAALTNQYTRIPDNCTIQGSLEFKEYDPSSDLSVAEDLGIEADVPASSPEGAKNVDDYFN